MAAAHKQGIGGGKLHAVIKDGKIVEAKLELYMWNPADIHPDDIKGLEADIENPIVTLKIQDTVKFKQWMMRVLAARTLQHTLALLDEQPDFSDWT